MSAAAPMRVARAVATGWLVAITVLLGGCAHGPSPQVSSPSVARSGAHAVSVETLQVDSAAFAPQPFRVRVYLPPGYVDSWRRYPVLYINDGQDMEAVALQSTLEQLLSQDLVRPMIVVAIDMPTDRMGAYGLSDRRAGHSLPAETRYGAVGARAHAYSEWMAGRLVPMIDARYRTRRSAAERTVLGWSLGALNAFNLAWQYPEVFARVGAFSPSFWLSSDRRDAAAVQRTRLAQAVVAGSDRRRNFKAFFAVGTTEETDDRDGDGVNDAVDDTRDLVAGWREGAAEAPAIGGLEQLGYSTQHEYPGRAANADVSLLLLEGGAHNQASWARMLPIFLEWGYGPGSRVSSR